MRKHILAVAVALVAAPAVGGETAKVTPEEVQAVIQSMFKSASEDWKARVVQDETQRVCSQFRNSPPTVEIDKIRTRELATVTYPEDGKVLGDWKKGEAVAQSGKGGQFTDKPDTVKGGNCYACHQMAKEELAYGTLGPSLTHYGKLRNFDSAEARQAYAKIYNAQSVLPCSNMPRFGYHKFLTVEQIKDVTAYLMSPDSPVNK